MANKIAVISDIHGKADLLAKLLKEIRKQYGLDIEIWSCGDLIDRGGTEKEVIDLCIHNGIKAVIGNHDSWVLDLIVRQWFHPNMIQALSAHSTLNSYGVDWNKIIAERGHTDGWAEVGAQFLSNLPDEHIAFFLNMYDVGMIDWLDDKVYWILHAGLQDSTAQKYKQDDGDEALMIRLLDKNHASILWPRPSFGGKKDNLYHFENGVQIFGHSYTAKPIVRDHYIALDTIGGGYEDKWTLSCIILPERKVIQVKED